MTCLPRVDSTIPNARGTAEKTRPLSCASMLAITHCSRACGTDQSKQEVRGRIVPEEQYPAHNTAHHSFRCKGKVKLERKNGAGGGPSPLAKMSHKSN